MADYDGVARAVSNAREELALHVTDAICEFLKRDLGIWLTEQQRDKLFEWSESEHVG